MREPRSQPPQGSFLGAHPHPPTQSYARHLAEAALACWNVREGPGLGHYHQHHLHGHHHHVIVPVSIIIKKFKEFPSLEGISGQKSALRTPRGLDKKTFLGP